MNYILIAIATLIASFMVSMAGQGGGAFYVPILLAAGYTYHQAAGMSLFVITCMACSAVLVYARRGYTDWHILLAGAPALIAGAFLGGYFGVLVKGAFLRALFGLVLTFSGTMMLRRKTPYISNNDNLPSPQVQPLSYTLHGCSPTGEIYCLDLKKFLPTIFLTGLAAGALGIGGGVVLVPIMVLLFSIPVKVAVATSSAFTGLTGLAGLVGKLLKVELHWRTMLIMAIFAFLGARLGARTAIHVSKDALRKFVAILLILIGLYMLYKASRAI